MPSIHSPLQSFNIAGGKNSPITYDPLRVSWTLARDTNGHVKDHLVALLRSIIRSADEASRRQIRQALVEHECINLIGGKLASLNISLNRATESQLRSALEPMLRNLPAKAVILFINEIFIDQRFWGKFKKARRDTAVSTTVAKIEKYAKAMPRFKLAADASEPLNDQILLEGDSVMLNIFCQFLSEQSQRARSD
ncbi:hypothetical protein ACHAC9_11265 [Massilia sp. CMS3.1]|uniref:hypothetical protein n=1 Tax=Massilia sp. CMS3.1 TaxID=3373083 RepID=UPI003EE42504